MTDRVRRNGQPSSCEPCRRSKLRCDHARPYCTRCVRRNLSRQCYYHPSPMTRGRDACSEALLTPKSVKPATTSPVYALSPPDDNPPADEYNRGTGLVTMHNSLMPFADSDGGQPHRTFAYLTRTSISIPNRAYPVSPTVIAEGVEVLRFLLDFYLVLDEIAGGDYANDQGCCHEPLFEAAWLATHSTLQMLRTRSSLDQLTSTALAIFEQTARPLELPMSAADDALKQALSGQRIRWETIGICCIRIGLAFVAAGTPSRVSRCRGGFECDRQTTMLMALDACTQCQAFCNRVEQMNELTLTLLSSATLFATWCCGDDSSRAWRLMGDFASAITALGFHKSVKGGDSDPPYLVELRKRLIAKAHWVDKGLATFVGRPPRLSRRYCVVDLPLDLSDSVIMGPIEQFEAAKAKLDENGWSEDIMVHEASLHRAMLLLGNIREEVLELSLGPQMPTIAQQARQILSKLTSTWESIPHKQYEPSMSDTMLLSHIWTIIGPRLECLYTEFLLHKLLIGQNEGNRDKMIRTSHEILYLSLALLKGHDLQAAQKPDLEWMMVFYAMPCASVLILELLRQNRQPQQSTTLNRSALIQDISVLISCCDTFAISGQSNYQICKQAQIIFSRCLDQILNPPTVSSHGPTDGPGGPEAQEPFYLGSMDLGLAELYPHDPEWSTWLESFDLYDAWPMADPST